MKRLFNVTPQLLHDQWCSYNRLLLTLSLSLSPSLQVLICLCCSVSASSVLFFPLFSCTLQHSHTIFTLIYTLQCWHHWSPHLVSFYRFAIYLINLILLNKLFLTFWKRCVSPSLSIPSVIWLGKQHTAKHYFILDFLLCLIRVRSVLSTISLLMSMCFILH